MKYFLTQIIFLLLVTIIFSACSYRSNNLVVTSPDGDLSIIFDIKSDADSQKAVAYYILDRSDTIIKKSALGIEINSRGSAFTYINNTPIAKTQDYNNTTITFLSTDLDTLKLIVKMYNDGAAFRYELPHNAGDTITKELTSFNIPEGNAWIQPYDHPTKWSPGYEQPFTEGKVGDTSPTERGWCFPLLFELSKKHRWVFISEADLDGTYPAHHVQGEAGRGEYKLRRPEREEASGIIDEIIIQSKWQSPWRFVIIGDTLSSIFDADMVARLSPPPREIYDWVKPGVASWSWWSDHDSPKNPKAIRKFIDLADRLDWEYSLIDANWNILPEDTIKSLIAYGNNRNVGIWLWYNSGGPHNTVEEAPRDKMHSKEIRRAEFAKLKEWGVKGVKIDFFQSDKTIIINQYLDIIHDAAEYQIMLNFHGCTLPRGWSTTYPHVLTMEAVRGAEAYSFNKEWPAIAAKQNTIYAFTRNLTGPMDYTPVTLSKYPNGRKTTAAHELALSVIFYSGIQHFADAAEIYLGQSKAVQQLLTDLPVTWDESRLISGYPGDHVIIARRKGNNWYVAGINGTDSTRKFTIDLSDFLHDQGLIFYDSENNVSDEKVDNQSLKVTMEPFGGFVCVFKE